MKTVALVAVALLLTACEQPARWEPVASGTHIVQMEPRQNVEKVWNVFEIDEVVKRCAAYNMDVITVESWRGVHHVYCTPKNKQATISISQP